MSIACVAASNQGLFRFASVPDYNAAYTFCGWFMRTATGVRHNLQSLDLDINNMDLSHVNASNALVIQSWGGATSAGAIGSTISSDTWYFHAFVRASATSIISYLGTTPDNITQDASAAPDVTGRAAMDDMAIGLVSTEKWEGRLFNWKFYQAQLTLDELKQEAASIRPQRYANLWGWWPLLQAGNANDYSGNGRDMSEQNTPTTADSPPVSWGAPTLVHPLMSPLIPAATLSGTALDGIDEDDIRAAGKIITITLSGGARWIP